MKFDFYLRLNVNEYEFNLTPAGFLATKDSGDYWGDTILEIPLFKDFYDKNEEKRYSREPIYNYDSHWHWVKQAYSYSSNSSQINLKNDEEDEDNNPIPF